MAKKWGESSFFHSSVLCTLGKILCFSLLVLGACSEAASVQEQPAEETPATVVPLVKTTEFVICIDNSRSIRPPEQIIIREATMLLADLADNGDRISVITFGEDARLVTSVLFRGDADRRAFKTAIQQRVDFIENLSDIRAGIRVLAEQREALFPIPNANHAAVVFSDGRLEPNNASAQEALRQLLADIKGPLRNIDSYAVVLGDTSSRRPISGLTPPLSGYELMRQHVATGPEYFYQAKQLEQLPEVAVTILNKTKGISSLGEESGNTFRIDQTVHNMTLIVQKRPADAPADSPLPESSQIQLIAPESQTAPPSNENIYRSRDYQHFDLFVVRSPRPGLWKVVRSDGGPLNVLSKVVSPVQLQIKSRPYYFLNEASTIRAWLVNEDKQAVATDGFELQAHVARPSELADSPHYLPMQPDVQTGQYRLQVPASLIDVLGDEPAPERVALEIIAQQPDDSWFLRRSQPFEVALRQSLIDWFTANRVIKPIPTRTASVSFGGMLNEQPYAEIGFETPPELTLIVERFDSETKQFSPVSEEHAKAVVEDERIVFRLSEALPEYGDYHYRYRLSGQTPAGPVAIQSPWFPLRIQYFWELAGLAGLLLLIVMQILSSLVAKLKGQIQIEKTGPNPGFESITVPPRRSMMVPVGSVRLHIRAKRYLFLISFVCVKLTGANATLDNAQLESGKNRCVRPRGAHNLNFSHDGNTVSIKLLLRV